MELFNKIIKVVVSLQVVILLLIIMAWFGTETAMTTMEMGSWALEMEATYGEGVWQRLEELEKIAK